MNNNVWFASLKILITSLVILTTFILLGTGTAQTIPLITEFSVTGADMGTYPFAINNNKQVVGNYVSSVTGSHGFLRRPSGAIITIDAPGFTGTNIYSINNLGQITGYTGGHGFVRSQGKITVFDPPNSFFTQTFAINDGGQVAGDYADSNFAWHGFMRDSAGNLTLFDVPGAGMQITQGTFPTGLNGTGVIAGYWQDSNNVRHGFVRDATGIITKFDAPGAGTSAHQGTIPEAINAEDVVAGYYTDKNNVSHGFVRDANGNVTAFDPTGSTLTFGRSINGLGQVVGVYLDHSAVMHGFVRSPSGHINSFNAPGAGKSPGQGTYAEGISSANGLHVTGVWVDAKNLWQGFLF